MPGEQAVSLVLSALATAVEARNIGPAKLGRRFTNHTQAEAALFLDRSFTEGGSFGSLCEVFAARVDLTVARPSKAPRGVVWGSLAIGLVLGFVVARVVVPAGDSELLFIAGLGMGIVIAIAAIVVAIRIDALASGRSAATAASLDEVVRAWLAERGDVAMRAASAEAARESPGADDADQEPTARKGKKKKKRPVESGDAPR